MMEKDQVSSSLFQTAHAEFPGRATLRLDARRHISEQGRPAPMERKAFSGLVGLTVKQIYAYCVRVAKPLEEREAGE